MTPHSTRAIATAVMLGVALGSALARAHEGDAAAPAGAALAPRHVLTAASARYELVLKHDVLRPAARETLDLYLSDFATNAPVAVPAIALSLTAGGAERWTGRALPTDRAGVYAAPFTAPQDTGAYHLLVTVPSEGGEQGFALAGFEISSPAPRAAGGAAASRSWLWALGGAALLGLLALFLLARRRAGAARHLALLIAGLLAGALVAPKARAHEGHDAAPATSGAAVGPGAQIYVAKESQFLLGVRTELVEIERVQRRLSVLGRVAPRGGGEVEMVAPQSGRIHYPAGQAPVIGQRVEKGQVVARLTIVDDLELRAPLTGVFTGVFVAPGQLVETGQKLMTLLDPERLWVHADVYEADVASVQRSTRAVITSPTMPDLVLLARRVALGVTQGEVPGTVEAWFEAPNSQGRLRVGALVDVGIELDGADSSLVVPRTAVFEKDGRKLVFIHTAPERFTVREVSVGASLGARVAVTGDLHRGDRVVNAGGYPLLTAPVVGLGR